MRTSFSRSALSDQLYGDPNHHARLRKEVRLEAHQTCDQLEAHPDKYAAFVETEKPFDAYVKAMRESGTYGGHLELAAFAQLQQKPIRIVQPGLVYVVACDDEGRAARSARARRERRRQAALDAYDASHASAPAGAALSERELRRTRRAQHREQQKGVAAPTDTLLETVGPLHIAYHNWEHYSSLRSLCGPHKGLPRIENPQNQEQHEDEELVMRSAPGHSLATVRRLLADYGDWEMVVEELIERDAAEGSAASSPSSAETTSSDGTGTQLANTTQSLHLGKNRPRHSARHANSDHSDTPPLRELAI